MIMILLFIFQLLCSLAAEEFCNWEIFQPRCSSGEIIIIERALFGRKSVDRCLIAEGVSRENNLDDLQFLGCYADVRGLLEVQCSGKQHCDVSVAKIEAETNCHKWLKFHLEMEYLCLPVVQESKYCSVSLASGKRFISSHQLSKGGCGSKTQPWIIESLTGQRINIGIFHEVDRQHSNHRIQFSTALRGKPDSCTSLGHILERENKRNAALCLTQSSSLTVQTNNYTSESNNIEVMLSNNDYGNNSIGYVLTFEATGCSDLIPPADAWLKRTEDEAIIGCYSTRLRWQLKCIGQRWIGVMGNCSQGSIDIGIQKSVKNYIGETSEVSNTQNDVVKIVAIAVTAFVICFLTICIGIVFINRYYAVSKLRKMKQMADADISRNDYNVGSVLNGGVDNKFSLGKYNINATCDSGLTLVRPEHTGSAQYFELDQSFVEKEATPTRI